MIQTRVAAIFVYDLLRAEEWLIYKVYPRDINILVST